MLCLITKHRLEFICLKLSLIRNDLCSDVSILKAIFIYKFV